MTHSEILVFFLTASARLKLYHWHTKSYPRHIASDSLLTSLTANIDQFVEVLLGKLAGDRIGVDENIRLITYSDSGMVEYLREIKSSLSQIYSSVEEHTDLCNILDEMVGSVNKTLYLFTLN